MAGEITCDVLVLGSGFAGLMSARLLARRGYRVVVVERAPRILAGASGRNEGWLHAGTYHAVSIRDLAEALVVTTRCIAGSQYILREFPECVEPEQHPAVVLVRDEQLAETRTRWEAAGVRYRPASSSLLAVLRHEVAVRDVERAFVVGDRAIDVRVLGTRLARDFRSDGGVLLLGVAGRACGDDALHLAGAVDATIRYRFLVSATGFATVAVCRDLGLSPPPVRLWRSHLASVPRLAAASVFALSAGEAAMMNHRQGSVVGLNEDARVIASPTSVPDPDVAARLVDAIRRRFPRARVEPSDVRACVKVDVPGANPARSLNVSAIPLADNAICALPGKMTEAPVVADLVAELVSGRLGPPRSGSRPAVREAAHDRPH